MLSDIHNVKLLVVIKCIIIYYIGMELIDIRVFIAIADTGSATRAAERLNMTQPGVSQHLARLEGELDARLFEREGKRLEINEFGRAFLGRARKLLDDVSGLEKFAMHESCPTDALRLGLADSSTMAMVPDAIAKFRKLYPGVHISIDVNDSHIIEHGILKGHATILV